MKFASTHPRHRRAEALESLLAPFNLGLPAIFNVDWIIDRLETIRRDEQSR